MPTKIETDMSKSAPVAHTPGPWVFAYGSVYKGNLSELELDDENALRVAFMDRNEPKTQPCERDANARLIAAAPDLLSACQFTLNASTDSDASRLPEAIEMLQAAIAKAEGR